MAQISARSAPVSAVLFLLMASISAFGCTSSTSAAGTGGDGRPTRIGSRRRDDVDRADQPTAAGSPCDDGNACSRTDTCQSGACVGGNPVVCTGGASCVAGACVLPACTGTLGFPGVPPPVVGPNALSVAALDLSGDGRPDLAVTSSGGNNVTVLLNTCLP